MNFKHVVRAAAAAALVAVSASASAGYVVLDGWQLNTPNTTVTNIGRLGLGGGGATVEQEVNGLGQAFVGAKFVESGSVFSVTYTPENVPGAGDNGGLSVISNELLTISFTNVAGKVIALNPGGGFKYQFTSGNFLMSGLGGTYAAGSIVGLGGNASSTAVIGGFNGDSTLLAYVAAFLKPTFDIKDSIGNSLKNDMTNGKVLFQAVTNNNTTGFLGTGACTFDATKTCSTVRVTSAGDAYLVRDIPEPASIALAGVALLGLGIARRRSAK